MHLHGAPSAGYSKTTMLLSILLLSASLLIGAQGRAGEPDLAAFVGSWKENLAKSHWVPTSTDVVSYTRAPDGSWVETRGTGAATLQTTFRIDGKEYPREGAGGSAVAWKEVGPNTWDTATTNNGLTESTSRRVISSDGKRMTTTITYSKKNEGVTTRVLERTSGAGAGLEGSWKVVSERSDTPSTMKVELTPSGDFRVQVSDSIFTVKPDGKEYPFTGTHILPNITVTLQAVGAHSIRMTDLRNHKPIWESTWTMSSDGKTITDVGNTPNSQDQPSATVYEKQ